MLQEFYGVVYIVTCSVNGKQYVGQTTAKDPLKYIRGHFNSARNGGKKLLYNAIRKYGVNSFTSEIIWRCPDKVSLDTSEDSFIKLFETLSPNGYNLRGGGHSGKFVEEIKLKIGVLSKLAHAEPKTKLLHRHNTKEALNRPDIKENHLAGLARAREVPGYEEKRLAASAEAQRRPEIREKQRQISLIIQNDPLVAAKRAATMQTLYHIPGFLDNRNASIKRAHAKPEVKLNFCKVMQEVNSRQDRRDTVSAALTGTIWANDGKRNFRLKKNELLLPGYSLGRYDTSKIGTARWINNGMINKRLANDAVLPFGWAYGMLSRPKLKGG